jgi:hypothetical protein
MTQERLDSQVALAAAVALGADAGEQLEAKGVYIARCYDKDGNLKWEDTIRNVVTTVGKNDLLDKYLAGSAYTASFFLGLISNVSFTGNPVAGDTMASHSTWTESQNYSQAARPTAAWAAAGAGAKALSSSLTFSINATDTIKGAFLATNSTKGGTTGILFSAGLFTGGDKPVQNTDTLQVSYSLSV